MPTIGYFLSCEEYAPSQLLEQARLAEEAGFEALWISDHYHPWTGEQGQSPFVWSLIGALMGPRYADMIRAYGREILPELRRR